MAKIIECKRAPGQLYFMCPACKTKHRLNRSWSYNGDAHAPTLSPSVLVTTKFGVPDKPTAICHSFVRDGFIQFLGDCTHDMAGKTIRLPECEEDV